MKEEIKVGDIVTLKSKDGSNVLYGVTLTSQDGNKVTFDYDHRYILDDYYRMEKWEAKKGDIICYKVYEVKNHFLVSEVLEVNEDTYKVYNGLVEKSKAKVFKYENPFD